MKTGFGLCCAFAPGNRYSKEVDFVVFASRRPRTLMRRGICSYAMVGTKSGVLQVFDLATGDMVQEEEAHEVS